MKFKKNDEKYLKNRKELSEKYGKREIWGVVDHWPLYCGLSNLARNLAISDLLKLTLDVPGHIAEFGSWRGSNLMFMAKLLRLLDPMGSKVVYGFEGFEGLIDFDKNDAKQVENNTGAYEGNYKELMDLISLYEMQDEIEVVKGNILETLPELVETNKALSFSLIYCDTDLHATTKLILESLHSRLSKNGLFVFDEWNYSNWPGETVAVRKFLEEYGDHYEMLHVENTRQPSLVLQKN
jgi:SAM-dependent methyltransferase